MTAIRNYFFPINPVTNCREFHLLPSYIEIFVGERVYSTTIKKFGGEIKENDCQYGSYVRPVKEVGDKLAAHAKRKDLKFEFAVIDNDKDTAWCLPGGKIGINVGLIRRMEQETISDMPYHNFTLQEKIAAVLSHEIVHADARHMSRSLEFRLLLIGTIIKTAQIFVGRRSHNVKIEEARQNRENNRVRELSAESDSQKQRIGSLFDVTFSWLISGITHRSSHSRELESDRYGMRMIRDLSNDRTSGFNPNSPQAAIWLQHLFVKYHSHKTRSNFLNCIINIFSSHPSPEERLKANEQTWKDLQSGKL